MPPHPAMASETPLSLFYTRGLVGGTAGEPRGNVRALREIAANDESSRGNARGAHDAHGVRVAHGARDVRITRRACTSRARDVQVSRACTLRASASVGARAFSKTISKPRQERRP